MMMTKILCNADIEKTGKTQLDSMARYVEQQAM